MQNLLVMFTAVFLAELGDKTQIATLLFAAKGDVPAWTVFLVASAALAASSALAVIVGRLAGDTFGGYPLKLIAGLAFIALGVLYVVEHFRSVG